MLENATSKALGFSGPVKDRIAGILKVSVRSADIIENQMACCAGDAGKACAEFVVGAFWSKLLPALRVSMISALA